MARDDFIERLEKYALSYTILRMDTTLYYGNGHLRPDLLILIEIEGSEYKLVVNTEHETNSVEGYYKRTENCDSAVKGIIPNDDFVFLTERLNTGERRKLNIDQQDQNDFAVRRIFYWVEEIKSGRVPADDTLIEYHDYPLQNKHPVYTIGRNSRDNLFKHVNCRAHQSEGINYSKLIILIV